MLQVENPARPWTWWEACVDAAIVYVGSSALVGLVLGITLGPIWSTLFVGMSPEDSVWGYFAVYNLVWLGSIPLALAAWTLRRGVFDQVFYFAVPKIRISRHLTLMSVALAFSVMLPYGLEFVLTYHATEYEQGVEYLLQSDWAPIEFLSLVVVGPFAEEVLWRGFLLPVLAKTRAGFWGATLLTSSAWGLVHLYDVLGTISVMSTGIALCYLARETRSILPCFIVHGAINLIYALLTLAH